jgi:hypothetical protein
MPTAQTASPMMMINTIQPPMPMRASLYLL